MHSNANVEKQPTKKPHGVYLSRWVAGFISLIIIGLVPWTVYLASTLPANFKSHDWNIAWVGFDSAVIIVLAYTAWAAWFRRQILAVTSIVAATLLICDAWFDINTSLGTHNEIITIITAVFGEVPLAIFLGWVARRIILRTADTLATLNHASKPYHHLRDAPFLFMSTLIKQHPAGGADEPAKIDDELNDKK